MRYQFVDESGQTLLGSDSVLYVDGRWNQTRVYKHALESASVKFAHQRKRIKGFCISEVHQPEGRPTFFCQEDIQNQLLSSSS